MFCERTLLIEHLKFIVSMFLEWYWQLIWYFTLLWILNTNFWLQWCFCWLKGLLSLMIPTQPNFSYITISRTLFFNLAATVETAATGYEVGLSFFPESWIVKILAAWCSKLKEYKVSCAIYFPDDVHIKSTKLCSPWQTSHLMHNLFCWVKYLQRKWQTMNSAFLS